MKKRIISSILAVTVILGMISLAGCTKSSGTSDKNNPTENKTDEIIEEDTAVDTYISQQQAYLELFRSAKDDNDYREKYVGGGLGIRYKVIDKPENNTFIYDGSELQFGFEGEAGWETTLGCLIYINGIPQTYHTDENENEMYLHSFAVEKDKTKSMKIYLTPNVGKAGEELYMQIVNFCGAAYRPLGSHDSLQPEGNAGTTFGPYKISMQVDGDGFNTSNIRNISNKDYTKTELSRLIYTREDGSIKNELEQTNFYNTFSRNIIENNKLHLFAEFGGGKGGEYIICAYLNGKVLKMYKANLPDDYSSRAVIDEYVEFTGEMLKEYDIQDYNIFYFIAMPANGNMGERIKSPSSIIASGKEVLQ